jgi:hypothetical protein
MCVCVCVFYVTRAASWSDIYIWTRCSRNVLVFSQDGPLRAETFSSMTVWKNYIYIY